jgi:hypothetical protein
MSMFYDAFIKLDRLQAAKMTELVNPRLDVKFDPDTATLMIHNLSFYEGYFILELTDHTQHPPIVRVVVCNDQGDVTPLDWTNKPIFDLNKSVPINLKDDRLLDYVRFFFHYVRGKHGRFIIIDSVDDIDWREEPAPAGRKALGKMIEPLHIKEKQEDGTIVMACSIIFKDSLFSGDAHIKPDGHIILQNEELLVEDIPVADDVFGL